MTKGGTSQQGYQDETAAAAPDDSQPAQAASCTLVANKRRKERMMIWIRIGEHSLDDAVIQVHPGMMHIHPSAHDVVE